MYTLDFDAGVLAAKTGMLCSCRVEVLGSGTVLNQVITPPDAGTSDPQTVTFQHYQFAFTANSATTTVRFTSVGLGNAGADQDMDTVSVHLLPRRDADTDSDADPNTDADCQPRCQQPRQSTPPTPTVQVSAIRPGTLRRTLHITVTASFPSSRPLTVSYVTTGSADQGTDYTLAALRARSPPGGTDEVRHPGSRHG